MPNAETQQATEVNVAQKRLQNARDHLANERTFLSWLRFGLAFAAFGFVVARFGLFVEQLLITNPRQVSSQLNSLSVPLGIVFVVAGAMLVLFAARRFFVVEREIERGEFGRHYTMIHVAFGLMVLGSLVVVGYLLYDWLLLR